MPVIKREIILDKGLESSLPSTRPIDQTWIFVQNWKEIENLLKVTSPARLLLRGNFPAPPETLRKFRVPPIILVFSKIRQLRFSLWIRYLPYLDFVLETAEIEQNFQHWIKVQPFTTGLQRSLRFPLPEGMKGLVGCYQRLKQARYCLTDHQWKIFVAYGKTGEINRVAELMERHPRTIRDQIQKINEKMEWSDLEGLFRMPLVEMLEKVPGAFPMEPFLSFSDKTDNKTGTGSGS